MYSLGTLNKPRKEKKWKTHSIYNMVNLHSGIKSIASRTTCSDTNVRFRDYLKSVLFFKYPREIETTIMRSNYYIRQKHLIELERREKGGLSFFCIERSFLLQSPPLFITYFIMEVILSLGKIITWTHNFPIFTYLPQILIGLAFGS